MIVPEKKNIRTLHIYYYEITLGILNLHRERKLCRNSKIGIVIVLEASIISTAGT